jgi:hypothetical protein
MGGESKRIEVKSKTRWEMDDESKGGVELIIWRGRKSSGMENYFSLIFLGGGVVVVLGFKLRPLCLSSFHLNHPFSLLFLHRVSYFVQVWLRPLSS